MVMAQQLTSLPIPLPIPPVVGRTAPIAVTAELKADLDSGGLMFGKLITVTGYTLTNGVFVNDGDSTVTIQPDAIDGDSVSAGVAYVSNNIDKVGTESPTSTVSGSPTLTINSDAIAEVALAGTNAIVLVHNNSKTADDKNMPEDLSVTVNKYGDKDTEGKLCIAGAGSAENIMLTVAGNSWVDLNSNAVKALDVTADANLSLKVSKFTDGAPDGASRTLESVMISGDGNVTMGALAGSSKLASIDASGSSGNNHFMSTAELAALTSVMGGSGNDRVTLVADEDGKLESIMHRRRQRQRHDFRRLSRGRPDGRPGRWRRQL